MTFENAIEFRPLVSKMSFIKNKAYWPLYLRGKAMIQIPKTDYDTIVSAAGEQG
jgi:predicted RNA-binding protein